VMCSSIFKYDYNETSNKVEANKWHCTRYQYYSIDNPGRFGRGAANTDFNNRTTTTNWAATTAKEQTKPHTFHYSSTPHWLDSSFYLHTSCNRDNFSHHPVCQGSLIGMCPLPHWAGNVYTALNIHRCRFFVSLVSIGTLTSSAAGFVNYRHHPLVVSKSRSRAGRMYRIR